MEGFRTPLLLLLLLVLCCGAGNAEARTTGVTMCLSTVARIYALFNSGDIGKVPELCTSNIVWITYGSLNVPTTRTYTGKKGVLAYFDDDAKFFATSAFSPANQTDWDTGSTNPGKTSVVVAGREDGTLVAPPHTPYRNEWIHHWGCDISSGLINFYKQWQVTNISSI